MFLKRRLKSSNPQTRLAAIRQMSVKVGSKHSSLDERLDWLVEQARSEDDPEVLDGILGMICNAERFWLMANDNTNSDALRIAAVRAYAARMRENARRSLSYGDSDEAQRLLDLLADECQSIAESNTSEAVRRAAMEAMGEPEPVDLKAVLSAHPSAYEVANLLLGERDPERIDILASYLEQMPKPKDLSYVEGAFATMIHNRSAYPTETVRRFTNVYANWAGISSRRASLKFLTYDDIALLEEKLNGDNINASLVALEDLQEIWNMGLHHQQISRMTYNGQPVATYRYPNAGNIITAPTH